MKKEVFKEIKKLEELKGRIIQELKLESSKYNEETTQTLICRKKRKYYQYYINGKYVSVKKEKEKLCSIAKREYHEELLPILDQQIGYLKQILKTENSLADIYNRMHEGKKKLFVPDYVPVEEKIREFENTSYTGLRFDENDNTAFFTIRGERVRSKSEKIIADELYRLGVPYKYEKPLEMVINSKKKEIYPDFTVINKSTGEIRYIEHLGMMDNPNYYKNALIKLDAYEKNGLLIGREVMLFHESSYQPLNTRVVIDYIHEFLM